MNPALQALSDALDSDSPDQHAIAAKVCQIGSLLLKKNRDYGSSVFEPAPLAPDVPIEQACRVRMSDKIKRLTNLFASGQKPANESVTDSFYDFVGYSILYFIILDGHGKEEPTT